MSKSRSGSGGKYNLGSRNSLRDPIPMTLKPTENTYTPGLMSGIGSELIHGMGFGTSSQVAHQAIRNIMGPTYDTLYIQHMQQIPANQQNLSSELHLTKNKLPCMKQVNNFAECIQKNIENIGNCQFFSHQLKECKQKSGLK